MSLARTIAINTIIQFAGKALVVIIGVLEFAIIARYLGQVGYGNYSTVYGFLAILGILTDMGLQMTTTQLLSDPAQDERKILSNALTLRLVSSLGFLLLAPALILFFPYPPVVKLGVAAAALGFVFASLTATLTSLFQKHLAMGKTVVADVVAKCIFILLLLGVAVFDLGLLGVIWATVASSLLTFGLLLWFALRIMPMRPAFDPAIWKMVLRYTWPLALTIALNLLYFKGDIVILSLYRSQTEVGLYGAPYKILGVLINAIYLFLGLILPLLSAAAAVRDTQRFKTVVQAVFDLLMLLAAPMVVGALLLGQPLLVLVAGNEFAISGEIFKILILATAIIFIAALFGYAVVALQQQRQMIKFYALNAVISLALYFWLIPTYSYWAAAWITVGSEALILLTAGWVLYVHTRFIPNLTVSGKALLGSLGMGAALQFAPDMPVLLAIVLGASVYLAAIWLLRAIPRHLVLALLNKA